MHPTGFRTLKLFPARELGPGWIRALAGPFPEIRFVAVGDSRPGGGTGEEPRDFSLARYTSDGRLDL